MMLKWYKQNYSKRFIVNALILLLASALIGQAGVMTWKPATRPFTVGLVGEILL